MKNRVPLQRWRPSSQTVEAIATVLCAHWSAASQAAPQSPFWPRPTRWLDRQAARLADGRLFSTNWVAPR